MGVRTTALTRISFRVIPRFLSAQIADECATLSVLSVQRLKLPASCSPIETGTFKAAHAPRRMVARARQHSDLRTAQAEIPRNREVPRTREERGAPRPEPISMRASTDLDAEVDRSRGGVRPISTSGPSGPSSPVKSRQGPSRPVRTRTLQRPGQWLVQLQQATTQSLSNRCRARVDAELGVGAQQVRLDGRLSDV